MCLYMCVFVLFFLKDTRHSLCWVRVKLFTSLYRFRKVAGRHPFLYLNMCRTPPKMPNSIKFLGGNNTYPRHTYLVPFTTYPGLKMKSTTIKIESLSRRLFFNGEKYPILQKPQAELFHKQPCMEQTHSAEKITAKENKIKKKTNKKKKQGEICITQRYLKICLLL